MILYYIAGETPIWWITKATTGLRITFPAMIVAVRAFECPDEMFPT